MNTEEKIKRITKHLLFTEGRFGATTQQIAQLAGLDRTAIHYYFRTRSNLIYTIIGEVIKEFPAPSWPDIRDLPLRKKLERYIGHTVEKSGKYPYLDLYVITQNDLPDCGQRLFFPLTEMIPEITDCIREGKTGYTDPIMFLTDLISMVSGYYISADFLSRTPEIVLPDILHQQRTERIIHLFLK